MPAELWMSDLKKILVCIDSYDNQVMKGRICSSQDTCCFKSTIQFLSEIEALLDENQMPQAYNSRRSFTDTELRRYVDRSIYSPSKGSAATFELHILFRQHSSWQGSLIWKEKKLEHSFRSVLELLMLMDSALCSKSESVTANVMRD